MKLVKNLTCLMGVLLSFQVLASEFTVASLLSDGYDIKGVTQYGTYSLVILKKKDKAYICAIKFSIGETESCAILK